ncbi:hypothetical protein [Mesorhizobium sp. M1403]|uniref:hypothetical protein n=1 Tax=Mesorhizobium sp. M1403 TaxID=2957097 RepID=UPI00333B3D87
MSVQEGRFSVNYWIDAVSKKDADAFAQKVSVEQTVEVPLEVVPAGYVHGVILGKVSSVEQSGCGRGFEAKISYSNDA